MVPSDVTWHQPKQTNYGAEWRHAARKWTAQLPDKCTLLHDFGHLLMKTHLDLSMSYIINDKNSIRKLLRKVGGVATTDVLEEKKLLSSYSLQMVDNLLPF